MECLRVQSWVLSFISYIQPKLQPYSPNTSAGRLYAKDVHGPPSDQLALTDRIDALYRNRIVNSRFLQRPQKRSPDLHLWMYSNRLSLTPNKMQFTWFGTHQQLLKLDTPFSQRDFPILSFIPVFETLT